MPVKTEKNHWVHRKLKFPSEGYPQSSNPDLPRQFFIAALLGPRGAGKSVLTTNLLSQYMGTIKDPETGDNQMMRVIVVSPTIQANMPYWSVFDRHPLSTVEFHDNMSDADIKKLTDEIQHDRDAYKKYQEEMKYYKQVVESTDPEKELQKIPYSYAQKFLDNGLEPPVPEKDPYVTFMICDDVIGTDLLSNRKVSAFKNLCIKNRHYGVNILLCLQALKELPRTIRCNCSVFSMANFANPKVINDLWEESGGDLCYDDFCDMYEQTHENQHRFLCADFTQSKDKRWSDSFQYRYKLS